MKNYVVEKHLDYLTVTSIKPQPSFSKHVYQLTKSPIPNYDMCEVHRSGMLHCWHSRDTRVGHHYIYQATALRWIRDNLMPDSELVSLVLKNANISRIDIAITSHAEDNTVHEFTPHEVAIACVTGQLKSRMKPTTDVSQDLITQTKYIGNRKTRRRLFRAYDKGLDNGELANILVRYELETRKDANVVGRMLTEGKDIGAIMRRYVDFPNSDVWQAIMDAPIATVRHLEQSMSADEIDRAKRLARWLWLEDSIAPVIARAITEDAIRDGIVMEDNSHYLEFIHAITRNLYHNEQE